jgi:hypothetical protein
MASEIRVNSITNRSGLGTVTFSDTGVVLSGVSTFTVSSGSVSSPSISPTGDSNTGIFFPAADTIAFAEGGVEVIRVNSSGNLGIGTNNPYAKTHIEINAAAGAGSGNAAALWLRNSNQTANNSATIFAGNNQSQASAAINFIHKNYSTDEGEITFDTRTDALTYAEKLRIDSRGIVTIPNQPAFHATGTGTRSFSGAQTDTKITIATNITPNTSSSYANSRFTAPVAGNYLFYLSSATTTATSSGPALRLYKNGVFSQEIALNYTNASFSQFGGSIIRSAVKDDYFEFYISNYNSTSFTIDLSRTTFGGHLIG